VLAHEPRICSTLYLPLNDPEGTYKMVKDFVGKKGVIGFTVVSPRYKAIYDNAYMKTFALLEEANMPLVFTVPMPGAVTRAWSSAIASWRCMRWASPGSTSSI